MNQGCNTTKRTGETVTTGPGRALPRESASLGPAQARAPPEPEEHGEGAAHKVGGSSRAPTLSRDPLTHGERGANAPRFP
jgi:hypothetical protein